MVINRLGVFVFYDPQGIADDYVCFLLKELSKEVSRLVIVVNGNLSVDSQKKLESYATDFFYTE